MTQKLTSDSYLNSNYIVTPGERLPYVPYFNYSANARYQRPVSASLRGYVQYDIAHKGDMWRRSARRGSARISRAYPATLVRDLQSTAWPRGAQRALDDRVLREQPV